MVVGAVVAALSSVATLSVPLETATAMPPRCNEDSSTCPEPRDPPGGPTGPTDPEPQAKPPAPFGSPSRFNYSNLATLSDAAIKSKLNAPATGQPWPLATIPYTPEIAGAPVSITQVEDNLWAFASFDYGGRAADCQGSCSDTPSVVLNPNYGLYQATLRMRPRLDVEFWWVVAGQYPGSLVPSRLTEVTATLHLRAFAECDAWETGTATLNAKVGIDNVTIRHDTTIDEDLKTFLLDPHFTARKNAEIRNRLMTSIGVGQFADNPLAHGHRCYTLGASGDTSDGAITWNEERCIHPETGCPNGGGVNAP